MKKVAIFDIDGTIFRSSLLIELVEALTAENIFPVEVRKVYARTYKNWLERRGPYEEYIEDVIKTFRKNIVGVSHKNFLQITKKVAEFHRHRVYRYTRDLIKKFKKKGYFLIAISYSPKEAAHAFGSKLGFDKIYGVAGEVNKKGKFTGKILHEDLIFDKEKVLKRIIEKENLTLRDSFGVGDTESDIKFLKMVKKPICFNPNKKLYNYARRVGWKIVVERKDVIYYL